VRLSAPYLDQPKAFWRRVAAELGDRLSEVYFPLPREVFGSGRPVLPSEHLFDFLELDEIPKNVLLNPVSLEETCEAALERLLPYLEMLTARYRIDGFTVVDPRLVPDLRRVFPGMTCCASTLMEISRPAQLEPIRGLFDALVPASWLVRAPGALAELRAAFAGEIKLLVNEGCLAWCEHRRDHFLQMNSGMPAPPTLCRETLERRPWLRLTGAWILPQHLDLLDGLYDVAKVAGRGTIHSPKQWMEITTAYSDRRPLTPERIGAGPAGVADPWPIERSHFKTMLRCDKACDSCDACRRYYESMVQVQE
jgi:hypothetical protein